VMRCNMETMRPTSGLSTLSMASSRHTLPCTEVSGDSVL
jgi:hypothetical protein